MSKFAGSLPKRMEAILTHVCHCFLEVAQSVQLHGRYLVVGIKKLEPRKNGVQGGVARVYFIKFVLCGIFCVADLRCWRHC